MRVQMQPETSYLSHIRGAALLPCERIVAILNTDSGLLAEPSAAGRLLVATDRRLINACDDGRAHTTEIYSLRSVSYVSLREDARRGLTWKHWASLVVGGLTVYLLLAYWLVDRLPEMIIPVINLHVFALVIMALVVLAGWLFWRSLAQAGGRKLKISGANWTLETECGAEYQDLQEFASRLLRAQLGAGDKSSVRPAESQ